MTRSWFDPWQPRESTPVRSFVRSSVCVATRLPCGSRVVAFLRALQISTAEYRIRMKRLTPLVLALFSLLLFVNPAHAELKKKEKTPGIELATMVSQVTGIAISPLLGVTGVGAYQWL